MLKNILKIIFKKLSIHISLMYLTLSFSKKSCIPIPVPILVSVPVHHRVLVTLFGSKVSTGILKFIYKSQIFNKKIL